MPTDNIKEIMDGDIFMQDQEGNIKKIAEITQFETGFEEKDDAADADFPADENRFAVSA